MCNPFESLDLSSLVCVCQGTPGALSLHIVMENMLLGDKVIIKTTMHNCSWEQKLEVISGCGTSIIDGLGNVLSHMMAGCTKTLQIASWE